MSRRNVLVVYKNRLYRLTEAAWKAYLQDFRACRKPKISDFSDDGQIFDDVTHWGNSDAVKALEELTTTVAKRVKKDIKSRKMI